MNSLILGVMDTLRTQSGKLSSDIVLFLNIFLPVIAVIASIWFIYTLIKDLGKLKNTDVSIQEAGKKGLRASILVFMGVIAAVSIFLPLVNTVWSEAASEGITIATMGMI